MLAGAKITAAMAMTFLIFAWAGTAMASSDSSPAQPLPATQPDGLVADDAALVPWVRGSISKIDGNDLTLHVLRGHSGIMRPVKLSDKTIITLDGGKPGTLKDLKADQWIRVLFADQVKDPGMQNAIRIEPSMAPWDEAKLVESANEEAKKAYRKRHGLAADAPAPDFDRDRKPTGAVHWNRAEKDGESWRVTLISTLTVSGATQIVSQVVVPLDKAGKLAGEVKFVK